MKLQLTSVEDAGLAVRAMRKHAHVRIDDFALTAGVSKQFMTDLENGKQTIQMGRVLTLLRKLGVKVTLEIPDAVEPVLWEVRKRHERRKASIKPASNSDA